MHIAYICDIVTLCDTVYQVYAGYVPKEHFFAIWAKRTEGEVEKTFKNTFLTKKLQEHAKIYSHSYRKYPSHICELPVIVTVLRSP